HAAQPPDRGALHDGARRPEAHGAARPHALRGPDRRAPGRGQRDALGLDPMSLLEHIHSPSDLKALTRVQLDQLAAEIRHVIIQTVARRAGHLAPNLGVVELTLALHRVFDSPRDKIIWDVGHQSYPHKLVTGRFEGFDTLRSLGGLRGYPAREESAHDP